MKFKKSVVGSVISLALSATALSSAAIAQEVFMQDLSKFKQSGTATTVKKSSGVYIVQLKGDPGIAHAQEIGELLPSNQLVAKGNQYNSKSQKMRAYTATLKNRQQSLADNFGNVDVIYNFVHTFNGFAAKLDPKQVAQLKSHPEVAGVWEDELQKITTANTPEFLGLTGANGQHTLGIKGEDIIVGVLDTGITPENPSFADDGSYSDPADLGWTGICDAGEEADEGTFTCNDKLIGARYFKETFETQYDIQTELGEFISPRDADGHGSHTASTAAGNENVTATKHGADFGEISGIAPRARVAMYKVCWNSDYVTPGGADEAGCFPSDSMAAIDQAIEDGVDVINFSIGGSRTDLTYPSTAAMLRAANAGVFVSVSAGNSGPAPETIGTPAPWVTTVAASTYDGESMTNAMDATINGTTERVAFVEGNITKPLSETGPVSGELVVAEPLLACYGDSTEPLPLDNAAEIEGNIALIQRGECAFTEKVSRAVESGAKAVVVYTVDGNPITGLGGDYVGVIPGGMIGAEEGDELNAAVTNGDSVTVELSSSIFIPQQEVGNIMADFSSRGPNLSTRDILKPDITAPGVRILAATSDTPMFKEQGQQVEYISGTSMASPHIAGMAALLMEQHPDWSPAQVRSALMTTAYQDVLKEDGEIPADPLDFGAGHANPVEAKQPGLTYDANLADYMAFMCGLDEEDFVVATSGQNCADFEAQGYSTDPSELNHPSISIGELAVEETVSRTVTDVTGIGGSYTVVIEGMEGLDVSVATFDSNGVETESDLLVVEAGGKASYALTISKTDTTVIGEWVFGAVVLTGADGTVVRSPVAVMPVPEVKIMVPDQISLQLTRGRAHFPVEMLYSGPTSLDYAGFVPPSGATGTVAQDPDQTFAFNEPGLATFTFEIPENTKVARFSLFDSMVEQEGTDLDLYVYRCTGWSCTEVETSLNGGSDEDIVLTNPEPRTNSAIGDVYIVWVHGWSLNGAETTSFTMPYWIASTPNPDTRVSGSRRAIDGRYNNISILTRGLEEGGLYMGGVTFYNDEGEAEGTTVIELNP